MSAFDESNDDRDDRDESNPRARLTAAAADRALFGGSASIEELELADELELDLDAEDRAFEQCVALLAEAKVNIHQERAPAALEARLHALCTAMHQVPQRENAPSRELTPRDQKSNSTDSRDRAPSDVAAPHTFRPRFDWLAAAACTTLGAAATFAILNARDDRASPPATVDPASFLRSHPSAVHWPWAGTDDRVVVGTVGGEAYFDPTTNEGLLVIEGLAPNDPTVEQYQLWIFDAARDERYPVDGGVFDVRANEPTRVPVLAKLPVSSPKLFAVTIEKPGGAVVSDRRIALLAKP
ncbi:MAG: hypothetical protein RL591_1921 [Planctomycetota bacterium]|jgi:hypothetical protein